MKRKIATLLALLLLLTSVVGYATTTPPADTVTSATTWTEDTSITTTSTTTTTPTLYSNKVYVVVSGDAMWKIAKLHNITLAQLIALNPQIKDANLIYTGQKINVSAVTTIPAPAVTGSMKVYQGMGQTVSFRTGPGKDSEGVQVYSFNIAMANATFDAQGRILSVFIDGFEVATPNYDGASMPHFSGWPDKEGYNVTDHVTTSVSGISVQTADSAKAEVEGWLTKRERGDSYHMNPTNEWYKQMDFFQTFFVGKTVAELEAWFAKNTTAAGRPIKATTTKVDELAKLALLTDAEKTALADVVAGATMSVRDAHGDFLGAVAEAYANRVEVTLPVK